MWSRRSPTLRAASASASSKNWRDEVESSETELGENEFNYFEARRMRYLGMVGAIQILEVWRSEVIPICASV